LNYPQVASQTNRDFEKEVELEKIDALEIKLDCHDWVLLKGTISGCVLVVTVNSIDGPY
jgi:hypothetical protein